MSYDDPNREAVGLAPIWTGAEAEPKQKQDPKKAEPEPVVEEEKPKAKKASSS